MTRWFDGLCISLAIMGASHAALAQPSTWPERPVKFISSQAAGNATDQIGRLVADQLSTRIGQPVIYENRPGGGNVIGAQAAARSAPDGYTFFFATAAALVTDPYTFKSLPYNPMKDFTVVSDIGEVSFMVLAHPDVPAKNLNELIALAKAEPDKLQIATDGPRRFSGMIVAWINKLAGIKIAAIPASNPQQSLQDALAGRVQLIVLSVPAARAHVASGKLRPLAVTSAKRLADFPDVPAVAETFPGFDFAGWFALVAPTGTPDAIVARVNKEVGEIMKDPALVAKLRGASFISHGGGTLQQARDHVQRQYAAWGALIKEIGLKPE